MSKKIANYILNVVENNGPLKVLQVTYGVIGISFFVVAGLVSLVNQSLGWALLVVPLVCFVALGMNVVAWALIRLMIDSMAAQKYRELQAEKSVKRASARKPAAKKIAAKSPRKK